MIINKVVLPSYHCIADIITASYNSFEHKIISTLKNKLTKEHVNILDSLLLNKDRSGKSPSVNFIKKLIHSLQPKDIAASVGMFKAVKQYFNMFKPLINEMNLSQQAIEYYAIWFQKASRYQINQFKTKYKAYLYLLSFIQHQYYYRHDMLVDVFLKSVQSSASQADKKTREHNSKLKKERKEFILKLTGTQKVSEKLINDISIFALIATLAPNLL